MSNEVSQDIRGVLIAVTGARLSRQEKAAVAAPPAYAYAPPPPPAP